MSADKKPHTSALITTNKASVPLYSPQPPDKNCARCANFKGDAQYELAYQEYLERKKLYEDNT